MLLVVDHQQNYSYALEDKNEAREFAIKYKGKACEYVNGDKEKGRVVGYNTKNNLVIIRTDGRFGWQFFNEEDVLIYKRYKIEDYLFYYAHPSNIIIINEQNVRKLSSKTSKRK